MHRSENRQDNLNSEREKIDIRRLQTVHKPLYYTREENTKVQEKHEFHDEKFQKPLFDYDKRLAQKLGINNFEPIELLNKSQSEHKPIIPNISFNKIENNYKK